MEELLTEVRDLLKELLSRSAVTQEQHDDTICIGTTGKGKKCTNKRIANSEYCGMHGGNKKRKVVVGGGVKTEKVIPVHTHESEPDKPCQVCIQHGDALDPRAPDASYSLEERLKGMLRGD